MAMLCFLLAVSLVATTTGQKGPQDPCQNYKSITNEKRSISYTATSGEPNICDNDIDDKVWYRFQALLPQRIYDQCVDELKCGTDQSVWLRGTHPTAADPGPKEVDVCSKQGTNCCGGWNSKIQVKFCPAAATGEDDYYVYLLKKLPRCDMAYCSGVGDVCAKGTAWNPNSKTCTAPFPNIADPIFEGPTIVKKKHMGTDDYDDFYFSCNIQWTNPDGLKKGEQFEVVFTFDGKAEASVPPKTTSDLKVQLWSKEIIGHVGKTIGCQVRAHWKMMENRRTKVYVAARTYFVGIKYSLTNAEGSFTSPRIEIDERSPPLTLYFQATVPISCPETTFKTQCKFSVVMADIADTDRLGVADCSVTFAGLDRDKGQPTQMIKAQTTPGIMNRASVLRFRRIATNPEFVWNQYQMPDIPIIIKDTSTTGVCESTGDPHITTFDKRYYHVYTEGDYLLAKSTKRHFEVHVRHHRYGGVTCNCAVAVREGNNVLGVNFCEGPHSYPTPITYLKDNKVPGATITLSGSTYTITMPSGAYVRADFFRGWDNSILFIYLYLNSEDYGQTSGLCGVWNSNPNDDTVPKGSTTNDARAIPTTFSDSYRLSAMDSFLNGQVRPIPCLNTKDLLPNICSCDDERAVTCAAPDPKTTTFVTQFTDNCNQDKNPPPNRRRRDSTNETAEEENRMETLLMITADDIPLPTFDDKHGTDVNLRWPTASGITKVQAETECQAKMEGSPVYQMCKSQIAQSTTTILESCVADAQIMDNLTVATALVASEFQRICVHELEISVVSDGSSTAPSPVETLLAKVVSMLCPNQCNGNGDCRNGTCFCNTGFAGDDCSVNSLNPPKLESFRKGVKCDFRSSYCLETAIFASNYFHSEKFSCKITAVDQSKQFKFVGSLLSNGEVTCRLPSVYRFTNETAEAHAREKEIGPMPFYRWDIALTNDGNTYSNSLRLTVFDSMCQQYRPDGTTVQKADTCVIGGRCFQSGEVSRVNHCKKCVPSKSRNSWTHDATGKVCPTSSAPFSYCNSVGVFAAAILVSLLRINV